MKNGKQIRKGVSGDHKILFKEDELKKIREMETTFFGNDSGVLVWQRGGGEFI